MMKVRFQNIALAMIIALLTGRAMAQQPVDTVGSLTGIEIKTSVDRAEIYIGDLITYTVTITYDSTYELVPPPLGANLGAFDVKDYQTDVITRLPDGRVQSENIFKLSTFTTGDYVIPPLPALFNLPDSSRKVVLSEAVPIKVLSMLENAGDSLDIKPPKAQYEFERDLTPYYLWGGLGLLLLIAVVTLIWVKLRRKETKAEPVDLRPPWEIAFEKLAMLKQKDLLDQAQYKLYYIELTEIVRTFHERMYNINVLDMTTEEFLEAFKEQYLPEGFYERTDRFLKRADLVKFAKFVPEKDAAEADFDEAHDMIEIVRADFAIRQSSRVTIGGQINEPYDTDEVRP